MHIHRSSGSTVMVGTIGSHTSGANSQTYLTLTHTNILPPTPPTPHPHPPHKQTLTHRHVRLSDQFNFHGDLMLAVLAVTCSHLINWLLQPQTRQVEVTTAFRLALC